MWLFAKALTVFSVLACSSAHDGATHQRHVVSTREAANLVRSWHWAQNILQAVLMMNTENKDWMVDSSQCALAVNNTLEKLANEYTELQVGSVLSAACDHMNVYLDFGGHKDACRPVFGDLAEEFDGGKDYGAWCEQAASMIAADKGSVEHHASKKEMVEAAKAELADLEAKRARGEDIHDELGKVKEEVKEAEGDEEDGAGGDDEDVKVGQAEFGSGESNVDKEAETKPSKETKPSNGAGAGQKQPILGGGVPFGGKPRADKLTKGSVSETNAMVDQIEKAQAAEEKRSAYRALTRLRGAMTTSYDAMAGKHMQNIDEYNSQHAWRKEHNVNHLAAEEGDVNKWAYPGNEPVKPTKK